MGEMLALCPGCRTELGPNDMSCPVCLRPRSRKEMMRDLNAARHEEEAKRKRPIRLLQAAALILAAGFAYKQFQHFTASPPVPSPAPATVQPAPPPVQPPPAAPPVPEPAPQTVPPQPRAVESGPQTADEEPPPPSDWTIHGSVYDILTLQPAAGARLTFENRSSGEVFKAKTNARGRYQVRVPKLIEGGYWVTVSAKGYSGAYLEEASPPYPQRTRAGREEAALEAAQTQILHVPITLDKETSLEYSAALLPSR